MAPGHWVTSSLLSFCWNLGVLALALLLLGPPFAPRSISLGESAGLSRFLLDFVGGCAEFVQYSDSAVPEPSIMPRFCKVWQNTLRGHILQAKVLCLWWKLHYAMVLQRGKILGCQIFTVTAWSTTLHPSGVTALEHHCMVW